MYSSSSDPSLVKSPRRSSAIYMHVTESMCVSYAKILLVKFHAVKMLASKQWLCADPSGGPYLVSLARRTSNFNRTGYEERTLGVRSSYPVQLKFDYKAFFFSGSTL